MPSSPATPKRPYHIDPATASERGRKAARARNSPDSYLRSLARADLTAEQKRQVIVLAASFLADACHSDPAGAP